MGGRGWSSFDETHTARIQPAREALFSPVSGEATIVDDGGGWLTGARAQVLHKFKQPSTTMTSRTAMEGLMKEVDYPSSDWEEENKWMMIAQSMILQRGNAATFD